jgi:DNA-binding transcriptional LysR family regulator
LVEEGIDVGVRIAPALDGRYVARPLARTHLLIYGTPEYFAKHGRPSRPADLASHRMLVFAEPKPMDELTFTRGTDKVQIKLNVAMTSNLAAALQDAVLRGVGLIAIPSFLAHLDLAAGRIEPCLLDWALPEYHVFAIYPHRRFLSPKVKVLVEALRAQFGDGTQDYWWSSHAPPALASAPTATDKPTPRRAKKRVATSTVVPAGRVAPARTH